MSREHLYKAKRVNWRELPKEEWWVEGFYVQLPKISLGATIVAGGDLCAEDVADYIIVNKSKQHSSFSNAYPLEVVECEQYEVDPETICEYTGLADKNGRKIFENDFVSCRQYIGGNWVEYCIERGYVEMKHGAFGLHRNQGYYRPFKDWLEDYEYEVIDNIFDNAEFLKGGEAK